MHEAITSADPSSYEVISLLEAYNDDFAITVITLEDHLNIDIISGLIRHQQDFPENTQQRKNIVQGASSLVRAMLSSTPLLPKQVGIWMGQENTSLGGQTPVDFLICPTVGYDRLINDEDERLSILLNRAEDFCEESEKL